mgnify:CR=1 FL=1
MTNQLDPYLEDLISDRFKDEELQPEIKDQLKKEALRRLDLFLFERAVEKFTTDEEANDLQSLIEFYSR